MSDEAPIQGGSLYGDDRKSLRAHFFMVWSKMEDGSQLEPLEALIADVIRLHPEYHGVISDPEANLDRDWSPEGGETNPFMHMALHIAVREQLMIDRPAGITARFQRIAAATGDQHEAEHKVLELMAEMLWEAQSRGTPPDEAVFLARLDAQIA